MPSVGKITCLVAESQERKEGRNRVFGLWRMYKTLRSPAQFEYFLSELGN